MNNKDNKIIIAGTAAFLIVGLICLALFLPGETSQDKSKQKLTIFHAGSLAVPFAKVSELFEKEHPEIEILAEAAGSRHCARKISDLGRRCDVMGSADYKVVSNLLMPDHANFNIRFALNEMVVAFTEKSRKGDIISSDNWFEVLVDESVNVGRADPDSDPCGYRTLMVLQLAEKHHNADGLYENLSSKKKYVRPKETDILALLETGEVDYTLIYLSVAVQHGLKYIKLADEINLKSADMADVYSQATVKVTGKKPGQYIIKKGEPMVYSVTIPTNAENKDAALLWVKFLLSEKGREVMQTNGQPVIDPPIAGGYENLPEELKELCVKP